jgi:hypothetical protein
MRSASALLTAILLFGSASLSFADQVRFTGNTTAELQLIQDVLRNVHLYSRARMKCDKLEKVVAEVLPRDFSKPGPPGPEKPPTTYERWLVTLCGTDVPFLISFWPATEGGTMFNVTEFPKSK